MSRCPNGTRKNKSTGKCESKKTSNPLSTKPILFVLHEVSYPHYLLGVFSSYDKAFNASIERAKSLAEESGDKFQYSELKETAIICNPFLVANKPIYAITDTSNCPFIDKQFPELIHPNYYLTNDKKMLQHRMQKLSGIDILDADEYAFEIDELR